MRYLRLACTASAVLGILVLTVSCGTVPPRMSDAVVIPVYYATDRKPIMPLETWQAQLHDRGSRSQYYGAEYNTDQLEMGVCPISVPTGRHHAGTVERPSWYKPAEHPEKHFVITTLKPLGPDAFFADLNHRLTNACRREVAVLIHGYNTMFATAALHSAQLTWDWGFRGVPILYSWPSRGTMFSYPRDEESAHLTQAPLRLFLQGILTQTAATNVHLIAHSLGCRALAEVLKTFADEPNPPRFGEVVLAAPDINQMDFLRDLAPALPRVARRVTLYAASTDKVLHASRSFHQYARAGDAAGELTVCQGIETIDASDADRDLLGHSYLVKSHAVIADIADVICRSLPPEQRNLTRMDYYGTAYWKLTKPGSPKAAR